MSARRFLVKFFNFEDNGRTGWLGILLILSLSSFVLGAISVFYKLTAGAITGGFIFVGILLVGLNIWSRHLKWAPTNNNTVNQNFAMRPPGFLLAIILFLLIMVGLYLLHRSETTLPILSPWQEITPSYIYVFFGATVIAGFLIFTRLSVKTLLVLLAGYLFLQHSYLPLSHQLFYGADQWRHLATEVRMVRELPIEIASPDVTKPLFLTTAPGNVFYSNFWAVSAVLVRVFNFDLISIVKWFMPIVWSLFIPVLLFELGRALNFTKKESLFLVWLSALPFALQFAGAVTVPNSFGLVIWLFFVLAMIKIGDRWRWQQLTVLAATGIASIFGYGLYVLLYWVGLSVFMILTGRVDVLQKFNSAKKGILMALVAVSIPAVEIIVKYSNWPKDINILASVKQFIGNLLGWYLSTGPRPHDITGGNIIFNQIPVSSFTSNIFTHNLWWVVVFMVCMWAVIAFGWIKTWRAKNVAENWIAIMSVGVLGAYFIGRYILVGASIISRRLDGVLAIFLIVLLLFGIKEIVRVFSDKFTSQSIRGVVVFSTTIIFSVAITASYSLGPDLPSVGVDQYNAAKYVWEEGGRCVIADPYTLLPLEYYSQKQVVGGGFPMEQYFGQPQLLELLSEMKADPDPSVWDKARALTGVDRCFFVANTKEIHYNDYTYKEGGRWKIFGDIIVWRSN